jgi:hypothetical protein
MKDVSEVKWNAEAGEFKFIGLPGVGVLKKSGNIWLADNGDTYAVTIVNGTIITVTRLSCGNE